MKIGQCDCCGKQAPLTRSFYCAIETFACSECRGHGPECHCCGEEADQLFEVDGTRVCGTCADDLADERYQLEMQREWP